MGGKASVRKGKSGEVEACKALGEQLGGTWRRSGMQSQGGGAAMPDVVCDVFDLLHIEVKRQKRPSIMGALIQAVEDTQGTLRVPVALTKADRCQWVLSIRLSDLQRFLDEVAG